MIAHDARKVDKHAAVSRHFFVEHKSVVRKGLRIVARPTTRDVEYGHFFCGGEVAATDRGEKLSIVNMGAIAADNYAARLWIAHAQVLREGLAL